MRKEFQAGEEFVSTETELRRDLRAARALIEHGWVRGAYWDADKISFCSIGALMQVTGAQSMTPGPRLHAAMHALAQAISLCGTWHPGHMPDEVKIVGFNDMCRDVSQVLAAFDKAIELS